MSSIDLAGKMFQAHPYHGKTSRSGHHGTCQNANTLSGMGRAVERPKHAPGEGKVGAEPEAVAFRGSGWGTRRTRMGSPARRICYEVNH